MKVLNFLKNDKTKGVYQAVTSIGCMVGSDLLINGACKKCVNMQSLGKLQKASVVISVFFLGAAISNVAYGEAGTMYNDIVGFLESFEESKKKIDETIKEGSDDGGSRDAE